MEIESSHLRPVGLLVLIALMMGPNFAMAKGAYAYVITVNDSYGVDECLSGGADCGQVVADAWCEAHGHGKALSFGPSTQAIAKAQQISACENPYVITCGD